MTRTLWHLLAMLALSLVTLSGCGGGGGKSSYNSATNTVSVSGVVQTGNGKVLAADATGSAGTVYAIDACTAAVLGQGDVAAADGTFTMSFQLPSKTVTIVLKADLGAKGVYREIFTFDASQPQDALATPPPIVISSASTARVASISGSLGVGGILGEQGVTTAIKFDLMRGLVAQNGGYNYATGSSGFSLFGLLDPALFPKPAAVTVTRADTNPIVPGATVTLQATVTDPLLQGKPVSFSWKLNPAYGPDGVVLQGANTATPTVILPAGAAFKQKAIEKYGLVNFTLVTDEPLVSVDRYQVVPFNTDSAVNYGSGVRLSLTATIDGKSYPVNYTISVATPLVPNPGLTNVPIGQPVVLQGQFPFTPAPKTSWDWSVTGPNGAVTVNDATSKYPDFIPTVPGSYTVTESGKQVLTITAGKWKGMMNYVNTPDPSCKNCHSATVQSWMATGHLQPLYGGIEESVAAGGHYNAKTCAICHTVGFAQYKSDVSANGFDSVAASEGGLKFTQGDPDPATSLWTSNPKASRLIGIQCENCHGPQDSEAHMKTPYGTPPSEPVGNARVSYASEVCAVCHGRATTHSRYQQWMVGGGAGKFSHANKATFTFNAAANGTLSSCQACHSAQGFAAWRKTLPSSPAYSTTAVAGLTVTNAEPITCVACHDPHNEGDADVVTSANLTKVGAFPGTTYLLPGGFQANGVGMGALCITCHNSRAGMSGSSSYLHEDGSTVFANKGNYGAPHESCQGDVLMGRNAYWLGKDKYNSPSTRSKHSYITDTCVTCHMELTDPSPLGAAGQKRHDFVATLTLCNKCHSAYSAEAVQSVFDARLEAAKTVIGNAVLQLKYDGAVPAGVSAKLVANRSGQVDVTSNGVTRRWFIGGNASPGSNRDAFIFDPNNNGALVQGCTDAGNGTANCVGFLTGVPSGTNAIFNGNGTIAANGANEILAKGLWNTVLVQDDASRGIHNPSFTSAVLDQTINHVMSFTP